jgi:hypothetical protein
MKRLLFLLVLVSQVSWGQSGTIPILLMGNKSALRATSPTLLDSTSFTANWKNLRGGTSYKLDVATDIGFTSYLSGFQNKSVTGTSQAVTGAASNTIYFYRVRCTNAGGSAVTSNTVQLTTNPYVAPSGPTLVVVSNALVIQGGNTLIVR